MRTKVFCIGFHKTGTSSLAVALRILGYRVTGPNGVHDPDIAQNALETAAALANEYDAFQDNPWPIIYREMDSAHPGSKFILTIRNPESWIKSQVRHFGRVETPMRKWIYGVGSPEGNEHVYLRRFEQHNEDVIEYFRERPADLLVVNLAEGDGWAKLCPFLGADVPDMPFPHANKASNREGNKKSLAVLRAKRLVRRFLKPRR